MQKTLIIKWARFRDIAKFEALYCTVKSKELLRDNFSRKSLVNDRTAFSNECT